MTWGWIKHDNINYPFNLSVFVFKCVSITAKLLVRAIGAVVLAVAQFLRRKTDGVIAGTNMVGELALKSLAVFFIWVILAIAVPVTHPGLTDTAS